MVGRSRSSQRGGFKLARRLSIVIAALWLAPGGVPLALAGDKQDAARIAAGHLVGHGGPIRAIAADPGTGRILTGSFDYAMMLWQLGEDGRARHLKRFDDHDGAVSAVAFLSDGRRALAGSDDGGLHLWDLVSGRKLGFVGDHKAKILGLSIDQRGRLAATASWDRTVRIWDLGKRQAVAVLNGHRGPVNAVAFTGDGSRLLSAGHDGTIRIWRVATGALERVAYRHGWGINVLQRFGGEDRFLFGGLDGTAAVFDLARNAVTDKLKRHEAPVLALAVLDQPGLVATGAGDGRIRVYRQGDFKLLETHHNTLGPVWALAFVDRGARIYFGSLDDFAIAWQVRPRQPFEAVPSTFPRRFQVADNISLGERQFARKCSICHTLQPDDANRAGPTLYRVFGRRAGSLPDYPYSKALKSLQIVWTAATIAKLFALGPHEYTPGSKMPLQRITDQAKRDALISYLQAHTRPVNGVQRRN